MYEPSSPYKTVDKIYFAWDMRTRGNNKNFVPYSSRDFEVPKESKEMKVLVAVQDVLGIM